MKCHTHQISSIKKDFYGLKNFGINYGLVFTAWNSREFKGHLTYLGLVLMRYCQITKNLVSHRATKIREEAIGK